MKKQTLNALKRKLDALNINYLIKDNKLIVSDENQPEDVYVADFSYPHMMNSYLKDVVVWLEERGYNFECEWSGTFSLCLDY